MTMKPHDWEAVIGLEIHLQLNTKTKLFSHAPNRFGDEPNNNITDVCTGQPGTLPLINQEAIQKAVLLGCALQSDIAPTSRFDRKSYFYPDSPRNYQITQFDEPILRGGYVEAYIGKTLHRFSIDRAHLEDDAGMLKHFTTFAGVDYNRAGVPLIEIVSKPCLHSAQEASAYAEAIKQIAIYIGISDCNMEEGALRMDANISVRKRGETVLRNKVEIKNMNSFHNMELAIETEIQRQIALYETTKDVLTKDPIKSGTYRFDPVTGTLHLMRSKENAEDYRYFPEPDLPSIVLSEKYIQTVRSQLLELPLHRLRRYQEQLCLPEDISHALVEDKALGDYFDTAASSCCHYKTLANWIIVEFTGRMKTLGLTLPTSQIPSHYIAELINMIEDGVITGKIAKSVADDMVASPMLSPKHIVQNNIDYQPLLHSESIEILVDQVLQDNAQSIKDYRNGKTRAYGFLVGQVMKLCQGKAPPKLVNELLTKKLQ